MDASYFIVYFPHIYLLGVFVGETISPMLERLSNLGTHRKIVVFGVLCLDHIYQPLPKPALRSRGLLPPLHLALAHSYIIRLSILK